MEYRYRNSFVCFTGGLILCVGFLMSSVSQAQCPSGQKDYDFTLGSFAVVMQTFLPTWFTDSRWDDVLYQQGPYFVDLDNDANGIMDDDHFDFLAAVLDGTPTSLTGVPQENIDTVRSAFASNRAYTSTIEFTLPRVQGKVFGIKIYDGPLTTGGSISLPFVGEQTIPSLWELLNDESPVFKEGLLDLISGYMTIGDATSVEHLRSMIGVIIERFIVDKLPEILANLKSAGALQDLAINEEINWEGYEKPVAKSVKGAPDLNFTVTISGFDVNIIIAGSDIDTGVNTFINNFSCTNYSCQSAILGAVGDLNGDVTANGTSYVNAGGDRQGFMLNEGIVDPPLEITLQPLSQTVNAGDPVSMSIAHVGGQDGGTVLYFWDLTDAESFEVLGNVAMSRDFTIPYAVPANAGSYTATICDGLWTRRSDLAALAVNAVEFQIISQPSGGTYTEGERITLMVNVTGGEAIPSFDWQMDSGGGFVSLGINASGIEILNATIANSGNYRCVITGVQGGTSAQLISDTATVMVNPVGEGVVEGAVEGQTEGEGAEEGAVEGQTEGTIEGEGCILDTCPDFDAEGTAFYVQLSSLLSIEIDWTISDIDNSIIPDSWEVALFQAVLCRAGAPDPDPTVCTYLSNLDMLRTEPNYGLIQDVEHVVVALLSISTEMQNTVKTLGLIGQYDVALMTVKAPGEPFSAQGDPDGDSLDNLSEFSATVGAGLGRADYVFIALTPNPSEGQIEGDVEGAVEGEGVVEGVVEGQLEGEGVAEGVLEGQEEGEGVEEGVLEGQVEGEGAEEGILEGQVEGEGIEEGVLEGQEEGEGVEEGVFEGQVEGEGVEEGVFEGQVEGEGVEEGVLEGQEEGEGVEEGAIEGQIEGEGVEEGVLEGQVEDGIHTADQDGDGIIDLSELLRIIQFYNSGGLHCQAGTEDGYAPGLGDTSCGVHDSDYNPQDWQINISELLRVIQFYNSGGYHYCPEEGTEDGYCPGQY